MITTMKQTIIIKITQNTGIIIKESLRHQETVVAVLTIQIIISIQETEALVENIQSTII